MPSATMTRVFLAACMLAGCASGRSTAEPPDAAVAGPVDAKVWRDGQIEAIADAQPVQIPPDAYECQVQTQQLLVNPVLDMNPTGMGWVQQSIDTAAPVITSDDGVVEHSAPFKAWMGGFQAYDYGLFTVTDMLHQDVTVPAGTTALRFTGVYDVRTSETETGTFDTAQLSLVQPDGTPLETIKSLSNGTPTTGWTPLDHTFAAPHAGAAVRLRITTSNDVIDPTSFYFDTLALTATVCQ